MEKGPNANSKKRKLEYKDAIYLLFGETPIEEILSVNTDPDFWEFIGLAGGDACTYRVYKDGRLVEK